MTMLDRVKERTGSDLSDAELQAMIDGISAEIAARFGPAGPITVEMGDPSEAGRWERLLHLARPIDTSEDLTIVESDPNNTGAAADNVTLAETDYRVLYGGRALQRLTGGPNSNSFWAPFVTLTYTPLGETAAREEATIKLMMLDLSYRGGLKSERAGDYQFTLGADPAEEREKIFQTLAQQRGWVMA